MKGPENHLAGVDASPLRCRASVLGARVGRGCGGFSPSFGGCRPEAQRATFGPFNGIGHPPRPLSWARIREGGLLLVLYSVLPSWLFPLLDRTDAT